MDSGTALVLSTLITNVTVIVVGYLHDQRETKRAAELHDKMQAVSHQMNSVLDQRVEAAASVGHAAGMVDEHHRAKLEKAEKEKP